ncbi:hypothetical protein SVAN01_02756 [Stagonosporopsis vannaccii]|nr:hypothetical protein SVAN01_02756 [Stagonosporopsis vannaccii]
MRPRSPMIVQRIGRKVLVKLEALCRSHGYRQGTEVPNLSSEPCKLAGHFGLAETAPLMIPFRSKPSTGMGMLDLVEKGQGSMQEVGSALLVSLTSLQIAAGRSERRIEILEAFELLPATIGNPNTQRCHEIFPESLELRDRALTVYLDIQTMIEAMIACLMDKKLLARNKDGLKDPLAQEDLDEKKRRFRKSMDALEHTSKALSHSTEATVMGIQELRSDVASPRPDDTSAGKTGYSAQIQQAWQAMYRSVELEVLQLQLRSHLDQSLEHISQDLDLIPRSAQSCDTSSQGAMYCVLQSARFKRWLQSPTPDVLSVSGRLDDGLARYSSTSLLCGMIIRSLRDCNAASVLYFICSSHSSRFDPLSGPGAPIQSLIAQLLSLQEFDISFLRFGTWAEGLRANIISTYCRLLRRLVEQLPALVVFCIIDSPSLYEVESWADDLHLVLGTLLGAIGDEQVSARFKLLVTSASRTRALDNLLSDHIRLQIPTDVGDQRLLTDRSAYSELTDGRYSLMCERAEHAGFTYENRYDTGHD